MNPFFVSAFLLLLPILLFFIPKSFGKKLNLPPSPPRLPIIGNLHQLGKLPYRSLEALSKKYGPLIFLNLGQVPTLVVSSPDLVGEIVNNHDVVFSNRPQTTATKILLYDNNNIGFAPYGEYWRQARKICVVELLSLRRVQSFQYVREEEAGVLVSRVRKACMDNQSMAINLSELLISATNNITSRCILGQSFDAEDDSTISRVGELGNQLAVQLMAFSVGDLFPSLKWIDILRGFIGRLRSTFEEFDAFSDRLIKEHMAKKTVPSDGPDDDHTKDDFIDVLLRLQQDRSLDFEFTDNQLKAMIQDMFVAGIETSSVTSEWLMVELVRNPRVMRKAQEEVRRVVGPNGKVEMKDLNEMVYFKYVAKETMRLHPPAPFLLPRVTTKSVKLGGYDIPAKVQVLINAWAVQRDPSFWDQPEEFIPERFENSSIDFNSQDFQLIPFGFGRRRCPGLAFGIASVEYLITNLLYGFDWKLPNNGGLPKDMDMTEVYGITVHRKEPLHVVPMLYSP